MRAKISDLITPSEESVFCFIGKSTRWLTAYEISMLTGVSLNLTKAALLKLRKLDLVKIGKRIYGWENGEREYKAKMVSIGMARRERLSDYRLAGVEPLSRKLQRILGVEKAREAEKYFK